MNYQERQSDQFFNDPTKVDIFVLEIYLAEYWKKMLGSHDQELIEKRVEEAVAFLIAIFGGIESEHIQVQNYDGSEYLFVDQSGAQILKDLTLPEIQNLSKAGDNHENLPLEDYLRSIKSALNFYEFDVKHGNINQVFQNGTL